MPGKSETVELLPCPFCPDGGKPGRHMHPVRDPTTGEPLAHIHDVRCGGCHSRTGWHMNTESAVAAWNRRAPTPSSAGNNEVGSRTMVDEGAGVDHQTPAPVQQGDEDADHGLFVRTSTIPLPELLDRAVAMLNDDAGERHRVGQTGRAMARMALTAELLNRADALRSPGTDAAVGWRPIESAPKDGTRVLIVMADGEQRAAYWVAEFDHEWDDDAEEADPNYYGTPVGAWTDWAVSSWGMEEACAYEPTHWMPLPSPPSEPKGGE